MQKKILYGSKNAGRKWRPRGPQMWPGYLTGIFFRPDGRGWLWTERSTVYRTHDGGRSWHRTKFFESDVDFVRSMSFVSDRVGYALYSHLGGRSVYLVRSRDGGRNWHLMQTWPR